MHEHHIAGRQAPSLVAAPAHGSGRIARAAGEGAAEGVACRLGDTSCAAAHASRVSRAASGQRSSIHRSLLRLQRDYGNLYVGQVLRQAAPGEYGGGGMDAFERSIDCARGAGQSMDHGTLSRMETAFGADFSGVRIHNDTRADGLSESLAARAFTTGSDVFFRQGEYNPGTTSGRELLAHKLTHVVQQGGDGIRRKMTVSEPGDAHEVEADRMAREVIRQEHAQTTDRQAIARQEEEDKPLAAKHDAAHALQRQPEGPKPPDEEEKSCMPSPTQPRSRARTAKKRSNDAGRRAGEATWALN